MKTVVVVKVIMILQELKVLSSTGPESTKIYSSLFHHHHCHHHHHLFTQMTVKHT